MQQTCSFPIFHQGILYIKSTGERSGMWNQEEVKVSGMEAFLANKERARQLAAEQAAREEKAFILHPRDRSGQPLTIPRPFCLRTDLREVNAPVTPLVGLLLLTQVAKAGACLKAAETSAAWKLCLCLAHAVPTYAIRISIGPAYPVILCVSVPERIHRWHSCSERGRKATEISCMQVSDS